MSSLSVFIFLKLETKDATLGLKLTGSSLIFFLRSSKISIQSSSNVAPQLVFQMYLGEHYDHSIRITTIIQITKWVIGIQSSIGALHLISDILLWHCRFTWAVNIRNGSTLNFNGVLRRIATVYCRRRELQPSDSQIVKSSILPVRDNVAKLWTFFIAVIQMLVRIINLLLHIRCNTCFLEKLAVQSVMHKWGTYL